MTGKDRSLDIINLDIRREYINDMRQIHNDAINNGTDIKHCHDVDMSHMITWPALPNHCESSDAAHAG